MQPVASEIVMTDSAEDALPSYAAASEPDEGQPAREEPAESEPLASVHYDDDSSEALRVGGEPDVMLDIPELSVDEISLSVEDLHAYVSLNARVGNLVALDAGAQAALGRLNLTIKGVRAQALLKVRLEKVYAILARTLTTIDRNPELLASLLRPIGRTIEETVPQLGSAVGTTVEKAVPVLTDALGRTVEKTVPPLGQAVGATVEEAVPPLVQHVGGTVEKTVPPIAQSVGTTVEKTVPALGQTVGATVEKTVPAAGRAVEKTVPAVGQAAGTVVEKTAPAVGSVADGTVPATVDVPTIDPIMEETVPAIGATDARTDAAPAPFVPPEPASAKDGAFSRTAHRIAYGARSALRRAGHIARIPRRGASAARHVTRRILTRHPVPR